MKCPFCGHLENRVIDSRLSERNEVTRRRRECDGCQRRYTTYEHIEEVLPIVVKKDGRREPFERQKLLAGVRVACSKRPVSVKQLDELAESVEKDVAELGEKEIASHAVGERVMTRLRDLDDVAYVRFASVYREFRTLEEFRDELGKLARKDKA